MATISLTGNLFIQLSGEAKPSPIPLAINLEYAEKSVIDYSWATPQSNQPLMMGTVTAPRFIYVEVNEGAVTISTNVAGPGGVTFSANPTPQPNDSPATGIMFTFAPTPAQFYATTIAPTRAKIWFFE